MRFLWIFTRLNCTFQEGNRKSQFWFKKSWDETSCWTSVLSIIVLSGLWENPELKKKKIDYLQRFCCVRLDKNYQEFRPMVLVCSNRPWILKKMSGSVYVSIPEKFHCIYFYCLILYTYTLRLLTFSRIQLLSCLLIHEVDNIVILSLLERRLRQEGGEI